MQPNNVMAAAGGQGFKGYTLTAGEQGAPQSKGYQDGTIFGQDPIGTLTPDNDLHGLTISQIISDVDGDGHVFSCSPQNTPDTDASWIDVSVTGLFVEGVQELLLVRAARTTYDPNAGTSNIHSSWSFVAQHQLTFIDTQIYDVIIRWVP